MCLKLVNEIQYNFMRENIVNVWSYSSNHDGFSCKKINININICVRILSIFFQQNLFIDEHENFPPPPFNVGFSSWPIENYVRLSIPSIGDIWSQEMKLNHLLLFLHHFLGGPRYSTQGSMSSNICTVSTEISILHLWSWSLRDFFIKSTPPYKSGVSFHRERLFQCRI